MISGDRNSVREEGEIDLLTVWRVLRQYKYLIAVVVAVCGAVAVTLALVATPVYRAEVVVTEANEQGVGGIASLASQLGGLASIAGMNLPSGGAGPESIALLKSRRLAEEFITRNNLVDTLLPNETERKTLWWASRMLKQDVLTIKQDTVNGTITVVMEWTDPKVAADWANKFVMLVNELMRVRAMDEATRSVAYLEKQLERTDVVEIRKAIYNLIEAETKKLMLTNARIEYAFKVVDPSRPPELRVWPRRTFMVLFGCFLGFLIGSVAAFIHRAVVASRAAPFTA